MEALKQKLTYANVVATLALILAVAGIPTASAITATKVKKNSITSKQIKNGSIKASDLANGAVSSPKLANGSVTASKLAPIHLVRVIGEPASSTTATCAAGERLISGGGAAGQMSLTAPVLDEAPGPAWRIAGASGAPVALALCLSATPGS